MARIRSLENVTIGQLDVPISALGDGPESDLLDLLSTGNDDEERCEAAKRLAHTKFTRGAIFHPHRWTPDGGLDSAFRDFRGERAYAEAWEDLVVPHIMVAANDALKSGCVLSELLSWIRRHVRSAVERELLGKTTRQAGGVPEQLAEEVEDVVAEDQIAFAERRADLLVEASVVVQRLSLEERILALEYFDPDTDKGELARRLQIKPSTLRKRIERLCERCR